MLLAFAVAVRVTSNVSPSSNTRAIGRPTIATPRSRSSSSATPTEMGHWHAWLSRARMRGLIRVRQSDGSGAVREESRPRGIITPSRK
jgi:hypothetical protein